MGFFNRMRQFGQSNRPGLGNRFKNRFGQKMLAKAPNGVQFKTVTNLNVYSSPSGRNYVTKNGTVLKSFQNKNAPGGVAFTSGNKRSNTGYYGKAVYNNKNGYFSANGKRLFKHGNNKYNNYAPGGIAGYSGGRTNANNAKRNLTNNFNNSHRLTN